MTEITNLNLDYDRPIKIAEDVYWVGFYDTQSGLHCNPYLIVDGDEAVVIDGGSRPHFPIVMMKILQTGLEPSSIIALIYQHFDPDLCGSISNFEDLIDQADLKIISDDENNLFIRHYSVSTELTSLEKIDHSFEFSSGRRLKFYNTPYSHCAGSFVTFDEKTGILFSSDLFGSYGGQWELFLELSPECRECQDFTDCPQGWSYCPLPDILSFHKRTMPSERALRHSMEVIAGIPFSIIAPQHGSVIHKPDNVLTVVDRLVALKAVGIDGTLGDRPFAEIGDISALRERLGLDEV